MAFDKNNTRNCLNGDNEYSKKCKNEFYERMLDLKDMVEQTKNILCDDTIVSNLKSNQTHPEQHLLKPRDENELMWLKDLISNNSATNVQNLKLVKTLQVQALNSFNSNKEELTKTYSNYSTSMFVGSNEQNKPNISNSFKPKDPVISNGSHRQEDGEFVPENHRRKRPHNFNLGLIPKEKKNNFYFAEYLVRDFLKCIRLRSTFKNQVNNHRKKILSNLLREQKKEFIKSSKLQKEFSNRAKKVFKEICNLDKKGKYSKSNRKKGQKDLHETEKLELQLKEYKRQQRKLNFLLTQTELFSHFMSMKDIEKMNNMNQDCEELKQILSVLDEENDSNQPEVQNDSSKKLLIKAKTACEKQSQYLEKFNNNKNGVVSSIQNENEHIGTDEYFGRNDILFKGSLKNYQLKGVNWLAGLYDKGINGILADEMGLGKTVQTISFLAYLSQIHNIWGPFLIVSPSSTLHNWQQEIARFLPEFKIVPYWGNMNERKLLRSFWGKRKELNFSKRDAPFHVLITSYQLILKDCNYFKKIEWQYMVLDEAQAIKSSQSLRWKTLLQFECRNRLLLSGTPVQNSMAELWSLLHFIMPTLFDSHEEFSEWFSKDIEGSVESKSVVDEAQLSRLHMILKPFMLRRTKKEVESELTEKIEINQPCELSIRQKIIYDILKKKLSCEEMMLRGDHTLFSVKEGSGSGFLTNSTQLMNLVVQFRKVCNHPDLFERRDIISPYFFNEYPRFSFPNLFQHHKYGIIRRKRFSGALDHMMNIYSPSNVYHNSNQLLSLCLLLNISFSDMDLLLRNPIYRIKEYLKENLTSPSHQNLLISLKDNSFYERSYILNSLTFINPTENFSCHNMAFLKKIDISESIEDSKSFEKSYVEKSAFPNFLLNAYNTPVITKKPKTKFISKRYKLEKINSRLEELNHTMFLYNNKITSLSLLRNVKMDWIYEEKIGFNALRDLNLYWNGISLPDPTQIVRDSGKMMMLDKLLTRLKAQNHRVLLYSQMTKMIDILEDYIIKCKYKYVRLDGSSKMLDRKETVYDFQNNVDIFIFLLSTRAGGIGINLTAADTVIFYDSDWNPTVDQQAMDRAHRLGQTRQVTVYRLICNGTVEERILQRAQEKSTVQDMVISGSKNKSDSLKPKEVIELLLDDEELKNKLLQKKRIFMNDKKTNRKRKSENVK